MKAMRGRAAADATRGTDHEREYYSRGGTA